MDNSEWICYVCQKLQPPNSRTPTFWSESAPCCTECFLNVVDVHYYWLNGDPSLPLMVSIEADRLWGDNQFKLQYCGVLEGAEPVEGKDQACYLCNRRMRISRDFKPASGLPSLYCDYCYFGNVFLIIGGWDNSYFLSNAPEVQKLWDSDQYRQRYCGETGQVNHDLIKTCYLCGPTQPANCWSREGHPLCSDCDGFKRQYGGRVAKATMEGSDWISYLGL